MLYWRGPPTQKLAKIQLTIMCELAGSQHREIGTAISRNNASWRGPNIENFEKIFYRQCRLGRDRNKFCENIIFVLLPLSFLFQSRDVKILRKNNATN
ncbi:hypothetical protein SAB0206 [Staphylococcus aureus RF122]|nr:hypothetical protein SAB0206 [Staphylococcus aureus RF122]